MKNCTANRSKEWGGGGVVSRSGFFTGSGLVTKSGFVTRSRFVKGFGFVTLLQLLFRLRQIGHCITANCQSRPEIFCYQPKSWYDGPASRRLFGLVAVRSKHKKDSVSYSATGCANKSRLHASYSDMPKRKSKLEAELGQNPTDLTTNFYIDGGATLWTAALR
jgi:hypothetical protein